MRKVIVAVAIMIGVLAAGSALAEKWDKTVELTVPIASTLGSGAPVFNMCANPPEVLEFSGNTHIVAKFNWITDENGVKLGLESMRHANHQNGGAIGYDVVLNPDGTIKVENGQPVKATDENGNFITTEYEVPGHYQWVANLNENHKDGDHWSITEVFMCHLISHVREANAQIHFNGHTTFTEGGQVDMYTDNYWCKCAGAGPGQNGPVDCSTFGEFCQEPSIPGFGG